MSLSFILSYLDSGYAFSRNITETVVLIGASYQEAHVSIYPITGDNRFDHLVKVVFSRCLHSRVFSPTPMLRSCDQTDICTPMFIAP